MRTRRLLALAVALAAVGCKAPPPSTGDSPLTGPVESDGMFQTSPGCFDGLDGQRIGGSFPYWTMFFTVGQADERPLGVWAVDERAGPAVYAIDFIRNTGAGFLSFDGFITVGGTITIVESTDTVLAGSADLQLVADHCDAVEACDGPPPTGPIMPVTATFHLDVAACR